MKEILLPNGKVRRYRSAEEIAQIIEQYRQSKSSLQAFCSAQGLRPNVLQRWMRKQSLSVPPEPPASGPVFQEVPFPAAPTGWVAEIAAPSGAVVRFGGGVPPQLAQLLCSTLIAR